MTPTRFIRISAATFVMALMSASAMGAPSPLTQDFVNKAVIGGKFEIETSQRALTASKNKEIRDFAQKMVTDHRSAEQKLENTVKQENMGDLIPATLDSRHREIADRLKGETGAAFDKDYAETQRDAHREAVDLFTEYSRNGDDAKLKTLAGELLPTLQGHLQMAEELAEKQGVGKSAASDSAPNAMEPAAGDTMTKNPATDRPVTNVDRAKQSDEPTTANPTEGRSSPTGGPTY